MPERPAPHVRAGGAALTITITEVGSFVRTSEVHHGLAGGGSGSPVGSITITHGTDMPVLYLLHGLVEYRFGVSARQRLPCLRCDSCSVVA